MNNKKGRPPAEINITLAILGASVGATMGAAAIAQTTAPRGMVQAQNQTGAKNVAPGNSTGSSPQSSSGLTISGASAGSTQASGQSGASFNAKQVPANAPGGNAAAGTPNATGGGTYTVIGGHDTGMQRGSGQSGANFNRAVAPDERGVASTLSSGGAADKQTQSSPQAGSSLNGGGGATVHTSGNAMQVQPSSPAAPSFSKGTAPKK